MFDRNNVKCEGVGEGIYQKGAKNSTKFLLFESRTNNQWRDYNIVYSSKNERINAMDSLLQRLIKKLFSAS